MFISDNNKRIPLLRIVNLIRKSFPSSSIERVRSARYIVVRFVNPITHLHSFTHLILLYQAFSSDNFVRGLFHEIMKKATSEISDKLLDRRYPTYRLAQPLKLGEIFQVTIFGFHILNWECAVAVCYFWVHQLGFCNFQLIAPKQKYHIIIE